MPRVPVIRDPKHPDFPHGTNRGYDRSCRCTPCRTAHSRVCKQYDLDRSRNGDEKKTRPLPDAVRTHLDRILDTVPAATTRSLARAAGVSHCTLRAAFDGRNVLPKTVQALQVVTPAQVAANTGFVLAEEYIGMIRKLQAAGWTATWQHEQTGIHVFDIVHNSGTWMRRRTADTIAALYATYSTRWPTAEDIPGHRAIEIAATHGQRAGYSPAPYYDEDGNIDPRGIPGHPWTVVDETSGRHLEILRAIIAGDKFEQIAERFGYTDRYVIAWRYARPAGLHHTPGLTRGLHPDSQARANEITAVLGAYDDGTIDAVEALWKLGLVRLTRLPLDHPTRVRLEAERAAAAATSAA